MMETTVFETDIDPGRERSFNYTPESMAHPAKCPPSLARALILTYSKKGDWVLDPFGGVGTTAVESLLLGRNSISVELEQKFVDFARANIEKATKNNQNALVQRPLGNAIVIQGDSRELTKLLPKFADAIVSSPPFASEVVQKSMDSQLKAIEEGKVASPWEATKQPYESEENIAWTAYGNVDLVVSSPPYADTFNEKKHTLSGIAARDETRRSEVGGYGDGEKNIGNLPHGNVDAVITSPPFEGVEPLQDKNLKLRPSWRASEQEITQASYTEDKGNEAQLANLKGTTYLEAVKTIYSQCFTVLKEGGYMCLIVKNFRRNGTEIDLEADTTRLCKHVGFQLYQKAIRTLHHASFWQQNARQQARKRGEPLLMPAHEYILIFRKPKAKNMDSIPPRDVVPAQVPEYPLVSDMESIHGVHNPKPMTSSLNSLKSQHQDVQRLPPAMGDGGANEAIPESLKHLKGAFYPIESAPVAPTITPITTPASRETT